MITLVEYYILCNFTKSYLLSIFLIAKRSNVKTYNEKPEYTLNIMPTKKTELEENFEVAVQSIKNSDPGAKNQPTNEEKLQFYGLYKQALFGDCNTPQPWAVQVSERAKWNAWNSKKGMTKQNAMIKYCELYLNASEKYGM